jgi:hypothetical protein
MIAKPEWFNRRKYSGWGLTPKTWQGFLYTLIIIGVYVFISRVFIDDILKMVFVGIWTLFVLIDVLRLMSSIHLDEREQKIEAISERNASWTMVASIALSILFVMTMGKDLKGIDLMPVLVFPVVFGMVIKGLSNYILDRGDV